MTKDSPYSASAMSAVDGPLKDVAHGGAPAGTKALVGGPTSALSDIQAANDRDMRVIFPVAALLRSGTTLMEQVLGLFIEAIWVPAGSVAGRFP